MVKLDKGYWSNTILVYGGDKNDLQYIAEHVAQFHDIEPVLHFINFDHVHLYICTLDTFDMICDDIARGIGYLELFKKGIDINSMERGVAHG